MFSSDITQSNLHPSRSAEPAQPIEHVRAHHVEVSHPPTISQLAIRQILQEQQDSKAAFTAKRADSDEMTLAEIDALFDAIYTTGVVTPDDSKKIDEFSAKCGKMDAKCSKIATRALKELKELTSTLSTIQPLEDQLQGCFDSISDAIYEQEYEGGALHAAAAFSSGIDTLRLLEANAQKQLAGTPSRVAAEEAFAQAKTGYSASLEDWVETTLEGIRVQKETLLEAYPTVKQEVSQLLGSLLVEEKVAIRTLLEKAAELKGTKTLRDINRQLRQTADQLNNEVKALTSALKEKKISPDTTLPYGSETWKALAEKHIPSPQVSEGKEWSPLAKRVVFGVLQGMQLTAGQLRFDERLADIEQTRESALQPLKDEISLLKRELIRTSSKPPKDTCTLVELAHWKQEVNDRSYAIERMEHRIGVLMESAREVLSPNDQELEKFGKKHANNIRLQRLVEGLQLEGVKVPESKGLNSDAVSAFLHKHAPEVFYAWQSLGKLYETRQGDSRFLESPEAKKLLETIVEGIEQAFVMGATGDLLTPEVIDWLSRVEQNRDFLMVRSTGAEDSRKTANAGGNLSRNYVKPTKEAFCRAAGEVVASYFGYASLQNRINAGDNPFAEELKLAVTAQELIGEPVGGKTTDPSQIPISLVLFTSEPLYVGEEKFRTMRISATHGHGEGVVGAQGIASDTAVLLISDARPDRLYVMYDNKVKPDRLAPVVEKEETPLRPVPNTDEMRTRHVLDPALLSRLYALGVVTERFFDDKATDMEIVIKGDTIYPVQARPVNRQPADPTYIDRKKLAAVEPSPVIDTFRSDVIVPGKSNVIFISSLEELNIKPKLEQAEKAYAKDTTKAVVVSEPEPTNSHPVVNFSGLAVTCLLTDDPEHIGKMAEKASSEVTLAIDSQTGDGFLLQGDPQAYVSQGYAVHPMNLALSVIEADVGKPSQPKQAPQEVKDLLIAIRSAVTHDAARESLQALKQHPDVAKARQRKEELEAKLSEHTFVPRRVEKAVTALDAIDQKITELFEETEASFTAALNDARLQPLIRVKPLESVVVGSKTSPGTIGQYSLMDVDFIYNDAMALVDYQQKFDHPVHFSSIYLAGNRAFDQVSTQKWRSFLENLEPQVQSGAVTRQQVKQLHEMIKALEKTNMLPTWFAFFFKEEGNTSVLLSWVPDILKGNSIENVLSALPSSELPIVDSTLKLASDIQAFAANTGVFFIPETFEEAFGRLSQLVVTLSDTKLIARLKDASPVVRLMIQNTLMEGVDLFDSAIKAMKASQGWTREQQVPLFKRMLVPYFDLLKSWTNQLANDLTLKGHGDWPLKTYIDKMESHFHLLQGYGVYQLNASPSFSVDAAVFGAMTAFDRHLPETLEDFFTLTHQNLIAVVSNLKNQLISNGLITNSGMPAVLINAMSVIEAQTGFKAERAAIKVSDQAAVIQYNVPLRNHSARLKLHFNKETGSLSLEVSFIGQARDRWGAFSALAKLFDRSGKLPLLSPIIATPQEVKMEWKIANDEALTTALDKFRNMAADTLDDALLINFFAEIDTYSDSDLIINVFKEMANDPNEVFRIMAHKLITPKSVGRALNDVLEVAQKWIMDDNAIMQENAVELYLMLIDQGIGYREALDAAIKGAQNGNVRPKALILLEKLVEKGHGLAEAMPVALEGAVDSNTKASICGFNILLKLYALGFDLEAAVSVAVDGIESKEYEVRIRAIELLEKLVDQGKGIEVAAEMVHKYIDNVYVSVDRLLLKLVDYGRCLDEAKAYAARKMDQDSVFDKIRSLQVYIALVNQDTAVEEATGAATLMANDSVFGFGLNTRPIALKLFNTLVAHGKGVDAALDAVIKAANDRDPNLIPQVIGVCEELVKHLMGTGYVADAIMKEINSADGDFQDSFFTLLQTLLIGGYPFQPAEIAGIVDKARSAPNSIQIRIYELIETVNFHKREQSNIELIDQLKATLPYRWQFLLWWDQQEEARA